MSPHIYAFGKEKSQKGFTLIELMVVISIISFLTSFMITSFRASKIKTVDASKAISTETYVEVLNEIYWNTNAYPDPLLPGGYIQYCLGNPPSGHCFGNEFSEISDELNAILSPYITIDKLVDVPRIGNDAEDYSGVQYRCTEYRQDDTCTRAILLWVMQPSQSSEAGAAVCKIPNSFCENNYHGLTKCGLILDSGDTEQPDTTECTEG